MPKERFLADAGKSLGLVYDALVGAAPVSLEQLDANKTALVIIDMTNGFAREGALSSPRVAALIPEIRRLAGACLARGVALVAINDSHTEASPEFRSYPVHCKAGSAESLLVDELRDLTGLTMISKNSTNGFIEPCFQDWLESHPDIRQFIVVGDCTDICILQFSTTLKAHFNRLDLESRVVVPVNAVDTFDVGAHGALLTHSMALFFMMGCGVEIANSIV